MIKKWDIYKVEFYATIKKNAFWQSGGIDTTNSPTDTNQKCWIKKKNTFKMHDVLTRKYIILGGQQLIITGNPER